MQYAQFQIADIKHVLRRRRWLLLVPPLLTTILCVLGAFLLPRKYESSTTIWVQPDEILNPLVTYTMAVQMASVDRLDTFNEIVYARKTLETVIDSTALGRGLTEGIQWDDLIEAIRRNIRTTRKGSDSFTLTYTDTDPVRAQRMVSLLAKTFIDTRIRGESRRNELTVEFFERKLIEYQERFDVTQREMLSINTSRLRERPTGMIGVNSRLEDTEKKITGVQDRLKRYQLAMGRLTLFPDAFHTDQGKQALTDLRKSDLPFVDQLRELMAQYDDVTARYTALYPEVGQIENQMLETLRKMRVATEGELTSMSNELTELRVTRQQVVDDLMKLSIDQQTDIDKRSNFGLYQRLYEDMKTKLEQARVAQELGKNAEKSFIIIDPARVPARPSKPNRTLIIAGGFGFGILLGMALTVFWELFDTRIRSARDIEQFSIPVIGLLPNGYRQ